MENGYSFASMPGSIPESQNYPNPGNMSTVATYLQPLEFHSTYLSETNGWTPGNHPLTSNGYYDPRQLQQLAYSIQKKLRYTIESQHSPDSEELLGIVETITGPSIATDIQRYFQHWHKHAPIVHEPSFNPCTAALPLVLALMGLGGMVRAVLFIPGFGANTFQYSPADEQVIKLKLFDTIETLIFSLPSLSLEYDSPGRTYPLLDSDSSEQAQQYQLEEVQGAYLYVVLQYWTGNSVARSRNRQHRFTKVVAVSWLLPHIHDRLPDDCRFSVI